MKKSVNFNGDLDASFPVHEFPLLLQQVFQTVKEVTQAPNSLIGTCIIGTMAALCQGSIKVKTPAGSIRPVGLYTLTSANSGERKSTVESILSAPMRAVISNQNDRYQQELKNYQRAYRRWDEVAKGLHKKLRKAEEDEVVEIEQAIERHAQSEPRMPRQYDLFKSDITEAALISALYTHYPSIAIYSSEAGGLFSGYTFRNPTLLNQAWDGSDISIERRSQESFVAKDFALSISVAVQPEVFKRIMARGNGTMRDTGFLARTLIAKPTSTQGYRDCSGAVLCETTMGNYAELIKRVMADQVERLECNRSSDIMVFDEEASISWHEEVRKIEFSLQDGELLYLCKDFASKMAENMARLAAIFQYVDTGNLSINYASVKRAAEFMWWYAQSFDNYINIELKDGNVTEDDISEFITWLLIATQCGRPTYGVRISEIIQYCPNKFREKDVLNYMTEKLIARGVIRKESRASGVGVVFDEDWISNWKACRKSDQKYPKGILSAWIYDRYEPERHPRFKW